jgi:hypothetical protein
MTPRDRTARGRYRILVIANEALEDQALHALVADHAAAMPTDVLLVATQFAAEQHLERAIETLDAAGMAAYGWVGHPDPLAAMAGALAVFEADELVIATHPRSNWLADDVVRRARERFGLPTAHVVVDRVLVAA